MAMIRIATLTLGSALALAGCGAKPPAALPPVAVGTDASVGGATQPITTQPAGPVAGSQEDFVATVMADRIFFDTDQADVDADDQAALQSQASWLARYPATRATVEGHCDERGTREYNLALGERRANATKNALIALGVSATRITTISYGKERPDGLGSDEESWSKNRRAVTVTVQ